MGKKLNEPDKIWKEIADLQKTFKMIDLCLKVDGRDIKLNREVLREKSEFRIKWVKKALKIDKQVAILVPEQIEHLKAQMMFHEGLLEKLDSKALKGIKKLAQKESEFYNEHGYYSFWSDKLKAQRIKAGGEKEDKCAIYCNGANEGCEPCPYDEKLPEPKEFVVHDEGCINCPCGQQYIIKDAYKAEPEKDYKYPKVVYQLGSDSKEYIELKKKYDKLIEDILKDLEELIAWSNNYPKDSEIYIRLKRKREEYEGR